ncbi:MAG: hypothetical protein ABIG80_02760 [Patescibacteria group bacterium]
MSFDFYGLTIRIQSENQSLVDEIERDFTYFKSIAEEGEIRIEMNLMPPRYEGLPELPAQFITPRNVCYKDNTRTIIDYSGKALCIHDRKKKTCTIQGADFDLVREICYLFILSVTGQYFDKKGLHRIHALGISRGGKAALLLMPSGGGKSTMALRFLSRPGFQLLSDDSPLVDRSGNLLGFPLRVGIPPDQESSIDPKFIRTLNRMEFDPKTVIDIEAFRDRLARSASPSLLLVGQRNLGRVSRLEPLSKFRAFKALTNNMIVGLGLYQGLEFLLERGSWEVFLKIGLLWTRLRNALRLLRRSECYRFVTGRDLELNAACLTEFLEEKLPEEKNPVKE